MLRLEILAAVVFIIFYNLYRRSNISEIKQVNFTSVIIAASIFFAVMISGGCGGSSNNFANNNTEGGDPNGPYNCTSEVAEKLIARNDIYDLAEYVKNTSLTIKKV